MNSQQKIGIDQNPFEGELNTTVKVPAIVASCVEEFKQRLYICIGDGPPVCEPRHSRQNPRRAGGVLRLADEDRATARSVLGRFYGLIRPADLHRAYVRIVHVYLV